MSRNARTIRLDRSGLPRRHTTGPVALEDLEQVVAFVFAGMDHLTDSRRDDTHRIARVIADVASAAQGPTGHPHTITDDRSTRT